MPKYAPWVAVPLLALLLAACGGIMGGSSETGEVVELDTRHRKVRSLFANQTAERAGELSDELKRVGVDELAIRTDEDYLIGLRRFFRMRERRFR